MKSSFFKIWKLRAPTPLVFKGIIFSQALIFGLVYTSKADNEWLPPSQHSLYEQFGLFIDNQTSILYRNGGKAWGALGASIVPWGSAQLDQPGQLVIIGSVNTAFRLENALSPETADARISVLWETQINPEFLLSFGYHHASGHVNDDVLDQSLMSLPVGVDNLPLKLIYKKSSLFRLGVTFSPRLGSDPASKWIQASQTLEIFPFGQADHVHKPIPYLAMGFEELGQAEWGVTKHIQAGIYVGNHLFPGPTKVVRFCLGYFLGPDPRMKYYYYRATQVEFAYIGFMINS